MKIIKNHYMQQMVTSSSIEPAFIKLVCGGVLAMTFPVEDKFNAWVKQT
jgi:hypothetical protein